MIDKIAALQAALEETTRQCQHWKQLAQSRDAAEGAGAVLNGIRDALETRGYFHMANGRDIGLLLDDAATPQSAPDAMRLAGVRLWNAAKAVALYRPLTKQVCHVPTALMYELVDALVFSSAPVPSPDGPITTEQLDQLQFSRSLHTRPSPDGAVKRTDGIDPDGFQDHLNVLRNANDGFAITVWNAHGDIKAGWKLWQSLDAQYAEKEPSWLMTIPGSEIAAALPSSATGVVDSGSLAHAQASIERQKNAPPNVDVLAADLVAAGEVEYSRAAEPVAAWVIPGTDTADANGFISAMAFKDGEFTKPLFATPPVRGDREAIARIICCGPAGCRFVGDSEDGSKCYCDTSDFPGSGIEKKADAIRSLPIQPNTEAKKK